MTQEAFLRPRLVGARFAGHAIPLEFLRDLATLEEMIIEVAKAEYLRAHPDRVRSPRGFTDGIHLKLTAIEDGSAIPVIGLFFATASLFPPESQAYFERARDSVISAIGAAESNKSITNYLPEKTLGYFDRFGRSLRDGEAIEFQAGDTGASVSLTRETRRKLLFASKVKELSEEVEVRGTVPEADQDDMTFELQLADGRKIQKIPLAPQHLETILEAFTAYKDGARVVLQGIGRLNRSEKLVGFESVEHVSMLDALDVLARLDELRLLKAGWLEGTGHALSVAGIDWFSDLFSRHYPDDLPSPFVYPTGEGGIRLEWSGEGSEASMEVDLENRQAHWHTLELATDEETERTLTLDQPEEWSWLAAQVRGVAGSAA